jgi:hypothetical protein
MRPRDVVASQPDVRNERARLMFNKQQLFHAAEFTMKALVWHGTTDIRCESVPDPRIEQEGRYHQGN